jgi:hypothetical protein
MKSYDILLPFQALYMNLTFYNVMILLCEWDSSSVGGSICLMAWVHRTITKGEEWLNIPNSEKVDTSMAMIQNHHLNFPTKSLPSPTNSHAAILEKKLQDWEETKKGIEDMVDFFIHINGF